MLRQQPIAIVVFRTVVVGGFHRAAQFVVEAFLWDARGAPVRLASGARPSLDGLERTAVDTMRIASWIEAVAEKHPELRKAEGKLQAANAERVLAWQAQIPFVEASVAAIGERGNAGLLGSSEPWSANYKASLDVETSLLFLKDRGKSSRSDQKLEFARLDRDRLRRDLAYAVRIAFSAGRRGGRAGSGAIGPESALFHAAFVPPVSFARRTMLPYCLRVPAHPVALAVFAISMVTVDSSADAQASAPSALSGRFSGSVHGYVTEPRGEFALNTGTGFGLGGSALWKVDHTGVANLRADLGVVTYGLSNRRVNFPNTGGLIKLDLNTTSSIFSFVAGPQIGGNVGRLSPYVAALGGFSVFWTASALEGSNESANGNNAFATTTNLSDVVLAYGGAAGVTYLVANGRRPVRLDMGGRFLRHDDVRYLNERRIQDAFENDRPPIPLSGPADFVTVYFGVNWVIY